MAHQYIELRNEGIAIELRGTINRTPKSLFEILRAVDWPVSDFRLGAVPLFQNLNDSFSATIPLTRNGVTPEVTPEVVSLLQAMEGEMSRREIMQKLGLSDEKHFREQYQQRAVKAGVIELTIPEKPTSRMQKYRLTGLGRSLVKQEPKT